MWAIITVLLTFGLTGLVGNRLIHAWQHRNWLEQQRLLDTEKDYKALQEVFDEVALLLGKRQYRMLRLAMSLPRGNADSVRQRLDEYVETVIVWNERLNVLYAKLAMRLSWRYTLRLEEIQRKFVTIGHRLETMTQTKLSGGKVPGKDVKSVTDALNALQGEISHFIKSVLEFISKKKSTIFKGIEFNAYTLDKLPTWELFKALFQPRIQRKDII